MKHKMNFVEQIKSKKIFFCGLFIAFVGFFFDILSKRMVFAYLENINENGEHYLPITSFFNLVKVWNRGVSFGMFNDFAYSQIMFSVIVAAILLVMIVWLWRVKNFYMAWALGLIISGALGNLYDRITLGAVADFLDFHIAGYHWPAFNLADSLVFVGVAMLLCEDLFLKNKK